MLLGYEIKQTSLTLRYYDTNPLNCKKYIYNIFFFNFHSRSDAQRAAKQKEAKERELEHAAFSADRIEEGGFPPVSMVSTVWSHP